MSRPAPRHQIQAGDGDARHGTAGGYGNHRCRCDECRRAWADAAAALRACAPDHHFGPRPPRPDPKPEWREEAACRGVDGRTFYAEEGDDPHYAAAKRVCARCPVIERCLEYAIGANEHEGCWAGLTPVELGRVQNRARRRRRLDRVGGAAASHTPGEAT